VLDKFERRFAQKMDDYRAAARAARETRHADDEAHLHPSRGGTGDAHVDHLAELGTIESGSAEWRAKYLVGSAAPEPVIEHIGPIGPEGFGVIRRVDGVTGAEIDTPRIYLSGGNA